MTMFTSILAAAAVALAPVATIASTAGTAAPATPSAGSQWASPSAVAETTPNGSGSITPEQGDYLRTLPALREGGSGTYVLTLQARLIRNGYDLMGSGNFGPSTKAAVADWQSRYGIPASGKVGIRTWTSLLGCNFRVPAHPANPQLLPGWNFDDTSLEVQDMVNALAWEFPAWARMSDEFDTATRGWVPTEYDDRAVGTVQDFQWRVGLFPSGIIGAETTKALDIVNSVAYSGGYQNLCDTPAPGNAG